LKVISAGADLYRADTSKNITYLAYKDNGVRVTISAVLLKLNGSTI